MTTCPSDRDIDERDVRIWFCKTELAQALDTFRVCEGILQARQEAQPPVKQRKKRSDAGQARKALVESQFKALPAPSKGVQ